MIVMPSCFNAGDTIYFFFDSYDSNGASVTITGLAVTDIEVYKNGSVTQRSSDSGYALLDTDGIDFDGVTGLHGFSIDTSDNTDAGFWVDGAQYLINVNSVTIDSQTVRFSYLLTLGYLLRPTTAGRKLDVSSGGEAGLDWANIGSPTTTVALSGTTVKTATDVETDTADIQSRLPAALVSGRIDASVGAMASNVLTAAAAAADFGSEIQALITGGAYTLDTDANGRVRIVDGTGTGEIDTTSGGVLVSALSTQAKSDVNAEADTALTDYDGPTYTETLNLFRLTMRKDSAVATDLSSLLTAINADLTSGGGSYSNTTDALEAVRDRGDSAWITATGFSTLDAAGVRSAVGLASANLDTQLDALPTQAEITGGSYALDTDANGRVRIVDGTGAGELDTLSGTVLLRSATQASIDAIEADTNELQTDWVDGGRLDLILDSILVDTAEIGAAGAGLTEAGGTGDHLTALPWNAAWDAEVQSEVQDAIEANNLDHLLKVALDTDFDTTVAFDSVVGYLAHDGTGTGTGGGFYRETDSLEAISQAIADLSLGGGSDWSSAERIAIRSILGFDSGGNVTDPSTGILDTIRDAVGVVDGIVDTILIDTNELQTDWTDGGRLDLIIDSILDDTGTSGVVLAAAGLQTDAVNEIRNAITGGAYALDTDANGRVRVVDGTGAGELDTASGVALARLADGVTHGGTTALLRLGSSTSTPALHITNSGGNAVTLNSTGGNGHGLWAQAAGTGNGIVGYGSGTGSGIAGFGGGDVGSAAGCGLQLVGSPNIDTATIAQIQSGLSTLTASGVRTAVGLASANLDIQLGGIDTDVSTLLTRIGVPASSIAADIAALNDLSAAEVNAEVDIALADINLDHLLKNAVDTDFPTTVHANSVIGYLADNGAGYDRTTDSLEAIADALIAAALNVTKTKAAVYDSVSRSGSVLTLSDGATQTISATGRVTA